MSLVEYQLEDVLASAHRFVADKEFDRAYALILRVLPHRREVLVPFVRACLLTKPSVDDAFLASSVELLFVEKAQVTFLELLAILASDNVPGVNATFVQSSTSLFVSAVFACWRHRSYSVSDAQLLALFRASLLIDVSLFSGLRAFMTKEQRTQTVLPRLFDADNRDQLVACVSGLFMERLYVASTSSRVWQFSSDERQTLFWRFVEDGALLHRSTFVHLLPVDFRVTQLPDATSLDGDTSPSPYMINRVTEHLCEHDRAAVAKSIVLAFVRYSAQTKERSLRFSGSPTAARAMLLRFPVLSFDAVLAFLAVQVDARHMLRFLVDLMVERKVLTVPRCRAALLSAFRVDNVAAVSTLYDAIVGRVSERTHNGLLRLARAASAGGSEAKLIECWQPRRFVAEDALTARRSTLRKRCQ